MLEFVVGAVFGASVVGLLTIAFAPWRRVRAEKPLDRDVETRVLLGQDPDDPPTGVQPAVGSDEEPRQYTPAELAQLRRIGTPEARRRRR